MAATSRVLLLQGTSGPRFWTRDLVPKLRRRTRVYVLTVTEILDDWRNSVNMAREWFYVEEAITVLENLPSESCFQRCRCHAPFLRTDHLFVTLHSPRGSTERQGGRRTGHRQQSALLSLAGIWRTLANWICHGRVFETTCLFPTCLKSSFKKIV